MREAIGGCDVAEAPAKTTISRRNRRCNKERPIKRLGSDIVGIRGLKQGRPDFEIPSVDIFSDNREARLSADVLFRLAGDYPIRVPCRANGGEYACLCDTLFRGVCPVCLSKIKRFKKMTGVGGGVVEILLIQRAMEVATSWKVRITGDAKLGIPT